MQKTHVIEGEKVVIKSRRRTNMGNNCGWLVDVNGRKFKVFVLGENEAREYAFTQWWKLTH